MKTFKKLFLVVSMSMVFVVSAFAESSFEFILNGKAGLSIGVPPKLLKDNAGAKGELGLDVGNTSVIKATQSSFDVGVELGLKFGPKA